MSYACGETVMQAQWDVGSKRSDFESPEENYPGLLQEHSQSYILTAKAPKNKEFESSRKWKTGVFQGP